MKLKELFDKTVFLIGAGSSIEADCLSSSEMLRNLQQANYDLDKPDENGHFSKYKDFQKQFIEIYDFVAASLNYQFTIQDSNSTSIAKFNIEDFVMVLKQIIDREYIVPYPLVGNWNDKITKWELCNNENDIFREFLNFIVEQLTKKWANANQRKSKSLIKPFRALLNCSESFNLRVFSLNYDLLFENAFDVSSENLVETGFTPKLVSNEKIKVWDESTFNDEHSESKLHLYKLHGSLNWEYDPVYELIKEKQSLYDGKEPLIIFGSAYKMLSFDPFLFILSEFRKRLINSSLLVVVGYSFHDKYINNLLIQQLQQSNTKRMIVVDPFPMAGTEKDFVDKLEKIQTIRSINDLINFKKANPEKIRILNLKAKKFYDTYLSSKAEKLKQLVKEAEKEDIVF